MHTPNPDRPRPALLDDTNPGQWGPLTTLTHDQALDAIRQRLEQPGTDELLRSVVLLVIAMHSTAPNTTGQPDPDCRTCQGQGWHTVSERWHCCCPRCLGCNQTLCVGPCNTVQAIADRLHLLPEWPAAHDSRPETTAYSRPDSPTDVQSR